MNILKNITLLCTFLFFATQSVFSQKTLGDTTLHHSPTLASLLSMALPGAGQVYNKKYWKVPIIYGIGGYLVYAATFNGKEYNRFKTAYSYATDNDPSTIDEFNGEIPDDQLKYYKDTYRRQRDLNIIGIMAVYIMNIVDASVDAHFFNYDISDNLSLNINPLLSPPADNMVLGISLNISLK